MFNGQGTLIFTDSGNKYVGMFKNDLFNGQGIYTYANGNKYAGAFQDDLFNGQGRYSYANGDSYVGRFKDDLFDGQGTYTAADGTVRQGIWKDGELAVCSGTEAACDSPNALQSTKD